MPFLEVKNLSQTFGKKEILKNISFEIDSGQVVAFLGPNGAGKTTLLKTVIGLYPVRGDSNIGHNQIFLSGKEIQNWSVHKRVEEGLVYLPQQTSLFQQLSVQDNLTMVFEYQSYWNARSEKDFIGERDAWLEI